MKFCANCGAAVAQRVPPGDSLPRWVCDNCGEIHYQNPKLVVGTIPEHEGRLLLCRRAIEPRYGYWTLPAGFMENDETASQAALRETLEIALMEEAAIPWQEIAFRTVGLTLKRWFADRGRGTFGFHAEDIA